MCHSLAFHATGLSGVGHKRETNDDRFVADDALGFYVVADGLGGHAACEVAAEIAVQSIANFVRNGRPLLEATRGRTNDRKSVMEFAEAAVQHPAARVHY